MGWFQKIVVGVVAIANFVFAAWGGWFAYVTVRNFHHATTRLSNPVPTTRSLAVTFFTLTSINVIFLALLVCAGVLLLRFRKSGVTFCFFVFATEIGYWILAGMLALTYFSWFEDIGGAEGIGNMGLAPQILTGYPIIGLIALGLVWLSLRRGAAGASAQ